MILPDEKTVKCDELYEDFPIQMYEHEFMADLYKFELTDFSVILGMDWLAKYQARIDYPKQRIILRGTNEEKVVHRGKVSRSGMRLITIIKAHKLLGRGCKGSLCNVVETKAVEPSI